MCSTIQTWEFFGYQVLCIFKDLLISLEERERGERGEIGERETAREQEKRREKHRVFPPTGSLPMWLHQLELGQAQRRTPSWSPTWLAEIQVLLPMVGRDSSASASFLCFLKHISSKQSNQDGTSTLRRDAGIPSISLTCSATITTPRHCMMINANKHPWELPRTPYGVFRTRNGCRVLRCNCHKLLALMCVWV